jgi:excisionase family DNA binding protein
MAKPILLTVREVAERKNITERQVQRLAKAGVLPVFDRGPRNSMLFRASDVRYAKTSLR